MNRIIVAATAVAAMAAASSNFVIVEPQGAAAVQAASAEGPAIISPLKITQNYGAMLPIEDWRPTN